ncbi:MAG: hypothetical protein C4576_17495 [Desulfobacteraceae bacterium]|nr:MAG: hypothetical protein C4576_17495 [Desulfobacteraceae bacterium]
MGRSAVPRSDDVYKNSLLKCRSLEDLALGCQAMIEHATLFCCETDDGKKSVLGYSRIPRSISRQAGQTDFLRAENLPFPDLGISGKMIGI